MYRRYYSMNDMPRVIKSQETVPEKIDVKECCCEEKDNRKIFGNFDLDDVILGIVILAILLDDGDDTLLLLALFAVFLTGHI